MVVNKNLLSNAIESTLFCNSHSVIASWDMFTLVLLLFSESSINLQTWHKFKHSIKSPHAIITIVCWHTYMFLQKLIDPRLTVAWGGLRCLSSVDQVSIKTQAQMPLVHIRQLCSCTCTVCTYSYKLIFLFPCHAMHKDHIHKLHVCTK